MNKSHSLAALAAAAFLLSACNQNKEPEVVGGPEDPMANIVANAPPPPPLPSIAATKKYRCAGNGVVQIDWLELNGKAASANVRVGDAAVPTVLTAAEDGSGYSGAEGASLTGTKDAASVSLTLPGQGSLTCKS
jgi:hypothetical protein